MYSLAFQHKTRGHQFIKPLNIFAKSIIFKSRFHQAAHLIILVAFVTRGLFGIYILLTDSQSTTISQTHVVKWLIVWRSVYSFIFALSLAQFSVKSHLYKRFFQNWQEIIRQNPLIANNFIIKKRKALTIIIITLFVYELLTVTYDFIALENSSPSTRIDILKQTLQYTFTIIISTGWAAYIHFLVESCIYLQSTFKMINYYLKNFELIKLLPSKFNASHKIRSIRRLYAQSVELIDLIDTFLSFTIFGFYIYFTVYCLFIFSLLFSSSKTTADLIMSIIKCIGESSYIIIVTYYLVHIHTQATQIFDKVYNLTLTKLAEYEYTNEINLFLVRVNQQDVGFKFARLFVIKPSFVSSLATVSLTLALTIPNVF
uniref:Gustatory receptor n=1 Tax=Tetranychus urticae TaxID=32264 RepID=T1KKR6_TETUR